VEQFGLLAKQLPGEREAAIGQLANEVTREREASIVHASAEPAASAKRRCGK
jgi:hypothetical protein